MSYDATRDRVEHYFDRTATQTWERLTSDAPVSGIRATVRAGRDRMRAVMLGQLPDDLTGCRILDAGCGTGAKAVALAERGAEVVAVDIAPEIIKIAEARCPDHLRRRITFTAGDMMDPAHGSFDHAVAMDSMIYYDDATLVSLLKANERRIRGKFIFTLAPKTPLLMAMFRVGKLFPRADRSPVMVPHNTHKLANDLRIAGVHGRLAEVERVTSGFYISQCLRFGGRP
ncbi:magnesium protoporphyrin IX methyltransferase [Pseudooctadecabacter sp.]|uniref:magnesium protoporphyrin IX methyltransferase n=1 Tax=Pseudooctadecabacter sp. TaxID=1966338 RepID=UPI0025E1B20B|nr:magnesium protoporphyrin IX methyltransferase [Pseudooctadecabacter sp.]